MMATLINNAGVQHYANKMVLAENRKVGSKSLPTALDDIDNLIDEMKTHFDAEYGSALDMELNNNENVFSVGTGTNVDKRSEVENSFTDVELSGNSVVNLCPSFTNNSTNLNSFNVPLTNKHYVEYWIKNSDTVLGNRSAGLLKKGVTYTTICDAYLEETLDTTVEPNTNPVRNCSLMFYQYNENAGANKEDFVYSFNVTPPMKKGERVTKFMTTFTPTKDFDRVTLRLFTANLAHATTFKGQLNNLIILEGDWTNKPLPEYFEGLKSIGEREDGNHKIGISSMGKNLFNMKRVDIRGNAKILNKTYNSVTVTTLQNWAGIQIVNLKLKPNTNYKLKFDRNNDKIKAYIRVRTASGKYSSNANFGGSNDLKFTMPEHSDYIALSIETEVPLENAIISNIQLEENSTATSYEPYKEDKKEISLSEPLRGLPNGTRDTIEKINGEWKIVRRCGEVILNGSENIGVLVDNNNPDYFFALVTSSSISAKGNGECLSDRLVSRPLWNKDNEGITIYSQGNGFSIKILSNKLATADLNTFKSWLQANPTKVVYELATPIIEDIDQVTLQYWKNGTISIDSVIPVESTHTVALNKPAQIQRNIEELTTLRKRVKKLEEMYDDIALEQAYKLSLINFNFELDYN